MREFQSRVPYKSKKMENVVRLINEKGARTYYSTFQIIIIGGLTFLVPSSTARLIQKFCANIVKVILQQFY
jgi:hypothetical protein